MIYLSLLCPWRSLSNNILLIGNIRAKATDFGMARLVDVKPRETYLTFTMCLGTGVYTAPETFQDRSVYTEKITCFSLGVVSPDFNTEVSQTWRLSTAAGLRQPMCDASGAVCGDHIYILSLEDHSKSLYMCSSSALHKLTYRWSGTKHPSPSHLHPCSHVIYIGYSPKLKN